MARSRAAAEPITISLWTHDPLYVRFFSARAEEWKVKYPEYEFTFDFQQVSDLFTKVLANMSAGEFVPDLLGLEQSWFPVFMVDDIIEQKFVDLTPMIGDERQAFVEGGWGRYIHNDMIFGVESALCAAVMYYQPALLEQHDFEIPATWEDLMEIGPQLGEQGLAFGVIDTESDFVFTTLFQERGGQYFNPDGSFALTQSENREAFQDVCRLYREGIDNKYLFPVGAADFWGPATFSAFRDGKVAGIAMPDWYSDAVLKANAADMEGLWRVAPMPRWQNSTLRTGTWGGTGFGISKDSQHIELVWDLLHYTYMTADNQVKRFLEIKYFPTMYDALNDPRIVETPDAYYGDQAPGAVLAEVAADTPVWYQSPVRRDMIEALGIALPSFANGNITADEMIDEIDGAVEDALSAL
jgi:multiple sugar transport system substrate-binding protein